VRFQTALTLGQVQQPETRRALQSILLRDYAQRWTRIAVLSSLRSGVAEILSMIPMDSKAPTNSAAKTELVGELAQLAVAREGAPGLSTALRCLGHASWDETFQLAVLKGLQAGLTRRGGTLELDPEAKVVLEQLVGTSSAALAAAAV
jgi:hypothetical protein